MTTYRTYVRKKVGTGTPLFWYFPTRNLYEEDGTKYLRILYVGLYQTIDKHHIGGISTTVYRYQPCSLHYRYCSTSTEQIVTFSRS